MGASLVWLCMPVHPRYIERGCDEEVFGFSEGVVRQKIATVLALTSTETSEDGKLTRQLFSCGCSTTSAWVAPFEPFEDGRDITRLV
ncbi:hypothetical protein KCU61_g121, partial [Aureobasidium melanogenum]